MRLICNNRTDLYQSMQICNLVDRAWNFTGSVTINFYKLASFKANNNQY